MGDAGYFRGTSAEQDNRFSDKEKKLMKQMKFAESLGVKVDMSKIKLEVLKPWISSRISELLGMEDDVLVEFVSNQLEVDNFPDGRRIQINLTGFLNGKNARIFTGELWDMLISAQSEPSGIPTAILQSKKEEIKKRNEEKDKLNEAIQKSLKFKETLPFLIKSEKDSPPHGTAQGDSDNPAELDKESNPDLKPKIELRRSREREGERDRRDDKNNGRQSQYPNRNYRSRQSKSRSRSPPPRARNRSRSRERERDRDTRGHYDRDRFRDRGSYGGGRPRDFDRNRRDRDRRGDLADEIRGVDNNRGRRSYQQSRNYSPQRRSDQYRPSHLRRSPRNDEPRDRDRRRHSLSPERKIQKPSSSSGSDDDEPPKEKIPHTVAAPVANITKSDSSESEEWMEVERAKSDESPTPSPKETREKKKKKKSKKSKKQKKGKKSKSKERTRSSKSSEEVSGSSGSEEEPDEEENEAEKARRDELERSLRERALESMKRAAAAAALEKKD